MWFPVLKSHTIIDLVGGTSTTVANIAATVAAYVAGVFVKDLKGDVLAVDDTKIVDSAADQANSVVTAGSVVGDLTGAVAGNVTGDVLADDTARIVASGADVANSEVAAGVGTFTSLTATSAYGSGKYQDFYKAAQAADAAGVLASTALTGSPQNITAGITDPDNYRVVSITGNQGSVTGDVVVNGTDWAGNVILDTIASSGASTVDGVVAFKTVTSIDLPVLDTAGDEISVGVVDILGLTRPVAASGDVIYVGIAADAVNASTFSYEAASSVDTTNNTVTLSTSITDADDITIDFYSSAL